MSKFLIYKSSAGSGKTTTLIFIFLKLSLATDDARQFKKTLAITFTNKAAAEMKERLISELNKLSNLDHNYAGGDFLVDDLLKHLNIDVVKLSERAQKTFKILLHDFNDLSIGTIDQFNHRLIRSFSRDLRLKSDFEVELDEKNLFHEAVQRLIERVGQDPYVTTHLLGYLALKVGDEKRIDIARDLEGMRNLVLGESALEAISALKNEENLDFVAIRKNLASKKKTAQEAIQKKGKEGLDFLSSHNLEPDDFTRKGSGYGGYFVKMAEFPNKAPNRNTYIDKALEGDLVAKSAPASLQDTINSLSGQLIGMLEEAIQVFDENNREYILSNALMWQVDLIAVLEELSACIDEICEERNILPISKFNKLISEALRKEPVAYLYEHYGMRFNHILIDEYQDTSELQWFNILPLIEESLAKGQTSMVVGDAKQSIYRWRGGKAEQLIALPELIDPPHDLKLGAAETLRRTFDIQNLATNYRSRINIVEFNNALFSQLGSNLTSAGSLYELEYNPDSVSQKANKKLEGGYIRVDSLGKKPEDLEKWDMLLQNIQLFRAQGYAFGEMAILVRSTSKEGRLILDRLQAEDIPVNTTNSFEIDKNVQVKLILAFLRLSFDTENTAAKIAVMRSMAAIFGIPFEPHLFLANNGLDLNAFLRKLKKPTFNGLTNSEGIYELTERLISTYLPDSKNSFLNALLNVVLTREGLNGTSASFFDWWDSLNEKPSAADTEGVDAIQLMTIHKSKGLQFKVVFVPDIDWKFRAVNTELKWFDLRENPISTIPFAPLPLNKRLIEMGLEQEWNIDEDASRFDNLNLIYVALTRAEEGLCISFSNDGTGRVGEELLQSIENIEESVLSKMPGFRVSEGDEDSKTIEIGTIPEAGKNEKEVSESVEIPWVSPDNEPWFSKVLAAPQVQKPDRLKGVRFHNIVAASANVEEAKLRLDRTMSGGEISQAEHAELLEMLTNLYSDQRFMDVLKDAKVLAERELLYQKEILRPDLVLEHTNRMVVIDFKTGDEDANYEKQVARYSEALRQLSTKPVEAYILYVSPIEWVDVKETKPGQPTLFD